MASPLQTLDTIFNSRVFRIPDYQRGYAWGEKEIKAFWNDLCRLPEGRKHYTGQITVETVLEDDLRTKWQDDEWLIQGKGYKPFYVVDGQQRLTTAVILIKCILDCVQSDGTLNFTEKSDHIKKYLLLRSGNVCVSYLFGYIRDNPSYEYLKTAILGQTSNQDEGILTTYTANLLFARDFFQKTLKDRSHDELERLFKKLTQAFHFNWYEIEQELDVFVVFETMNYRGKTLTKLELLKNRLIYLSTLLPSPVSDAEKTALRRNINDAWKTVYQSLGMRPDHVLDDDDFLRAHWIMAFDYGRDEAGQFSGFLLDTHFIVDRVHDRTLKSEELQKYVSSIQNSARFWYAIHYPTHSDLVNDEERRALDRLGRLGQAAFLPLLLAMLQRQDASKQDKIKVLREAERFIFVVSRLCQRRSNTGDSQFYRLAGEIFRKAKTVATAAAEIRSATDYYFNLEKIIAEMGDENQAFYSWSGIKFFLFEFEQELQSRAQMGTIKLTWENFHESKRDHVTVEHVYPQSPINGEWDAFDTSTVEQREWLRHSLGNLLALSQSRNSRFSNRAFRTKCVDEDDVRGYHNGSYSEIAVSRFEDWTPEVVLERGMEMLSFMEQRWEINLGTREQKLKLLQLEFIDKRPSTNPLNQPAEPIV